MSQDNNPFDAQLRAQAMRHKAPEHLKHRIRAGIEAQMRAEAQAAPARGRFTLTMPWFNFRGLAAGFAMGALCSALTVFLVLNAGNAGRMDDEVIASHVRATITGHLTDVISTNQHTVKPWLSGKLDFSPPVWNARPDEFPLLGGRVDYIDHHSVAALIYKRKEHTINVYVWPVSGAGVPQGEGKTVNGFHTLRWTQGGMQFWAVSDASPEELQHLRELSSVPVDDKSGS